MSNSSDDLDVVQTLGSSIFTWVLEEVIPVLFCVIMCLIFIGGVILHGIILAGLSKGKLRTKAPYKIILHVEIMDTAAMVLIILPALISSAANEWLFKKAMCYVFGILVTVFYWMVLVYAVWSAIERCLKVWNVRLHQKIFEFKGGMIWLIVMICHWVLAVAYSILYIPEISIGELGYRTHGYQCDILFEKNKSMTIVHFMMTYILVCVILGVCYCMIVHKRRMQLKTVKKIDLDTKPSGSSQGTSNNQAQVETANTAKLREDKMRSAAAATPRKIDIVEAPDEESTIEPPGKKTNAATGSGQGKGRWKKTLNKLNHIQAFERHDEFHVALTGFITWVVVLMVWFPYVIVGFVHAYEDANNPEWEGWYPLAVMIAYLTYVVKPIVYLSHNKHIRRGVRAVFPKAVDKLEDTQRALDDRSSSIDAFLFKQPERRVSVDFWTKPKIGSMVTAKMAITKWRRQKGKKVDGIKEELELEEENRDTDGALKTERL